MRTPVLPIAALLAFAIPATQAQTTPTLDKVKANGSITVAYRESSIPFSYLDDKAQPTGFGWEICGKIVEAARARAARQHGPRLPRPPRGGGGRRGPRVSARPAR